MPGKLLIVDDEADVREFAANFFRKRKIEVAIASSGEEALAMLKNKLPSLVLLDIKMAGIDGVEALSRIRQQYGKLKVIMVSGKDPEEDSAMKRCIELGADGYIHKPLQLDELERRVLAVLNKEVAVGN